MVSGVAQPLNAHMFGQVRRSPARQHHHPDQLLGQTGERSGAVRVYRRLIRGGRELGERAVEVDDQGETWPSSNGCDPVQVIEQIIQADLLPFFSEMRRSRQRR
jgi:hypothetical protein